MSVEETDEQSEQEQTASVNENSKNKFFKLGPVLMFVGCVVFIFLCFLLQQKGIHPFYPNTPEHVVREYIQALENKDVDRLCQLESSLVIKKEMDRWGVSYLDQYKQMRKKQLNAMIPRMAEECGSNWNDRINSEVLAETDGWTRLRIRVPWTTEPLIVDLEKENGRWKISHIR